jgi:hypothetical protein
MQIKYLGPSHFRVLGPEDLAKFGVQGFKETKWARDEPTDIDAKAGKALLDNLPDEFAEVPSSPASPAPKA